MSFTAVVPDEKEDPMSTTERIKEIENLLPRITARIQHCAQYNARLARQLKFDPVYLEETSRMAALYNRLASERDMLEAILALEYLEHLEQLADDQVARPLELLAADLP